MMGQQSSARRKEEEEQASGWKNMENNNQNFDGLQENMLTTRRRDHMKTVAKNRWISQPSSILLCALFILCTLLLIINVTVAVVVLSRSQDCDIQTSNGARKELIDTEQKQNCSPVSPCSQGWKMYGKSCYKYFTETKTWPDAAKYCEDQGSHLLVINSEDEQYEMSSFIRRFGGYSWLGLRKLDGNWEWLDGSSYVTSPKFWNVGQPDDWYDHGLGGGEDCAHIMHADSWNDAHCTEHIAFICEKSFL